MAVSGEPIYVKTAGDLVVRALRSEAAVIVEIEGAIDLATAPVVEEVVELAANVAPWVVVNLSEVSYLDSSALNALLRAQERLAEREVALRVVKPIASHATKVFDLKELPPDLVIVESLEAALPAKA